MQLKGSPDGAYKMGWKARGPALAAVVAGTATITITIGDDVFAGTLECTSPGNRTSCDLVP